MLVSVIWAQDNTDDINQWKDSPATTILGWQVKQRAAGSSVWSTADDDETFSQWWRQLCTISIINLKDCLIQKALAENQYFSYYSLQTSSKRSPNSVLWKKSLQTLNTKNLINNGRALYPDTRKSQQIGVPESF